MKNLGGTGSVGWTCLFLTGLLSLLFSPSAAHTQSTSTSIKLVGTQWQQKAISQANVDGSLTVLTNTYTFEKQGKVTLLIFISKGVGIATTGTPFGNIPFSSARTLSGTYRFSGNSLYIDFPDRAIEATVSSDGMKGILTTKANNHKGEWIAGKVSGQGSSSVPATTPESPQPAIKIETARKKRYEEAANYLWDGERLYLSGKYKEAIAKYDEGIKLLYDHPREPVAFYCLRGKAKVKVQDYNGAIKDFDKCIQNLPGKRTLENTKLALEDSYEGRGDAKLALKNYSGALLDYNQFVQLFEQPYEHEPRSGVNVGNLGLNRNKRKSKVFKDRGTAKYKLGDKAGACEDYRQSCRLSSDGDDSACDIEKVVCN
jgi:hypothetical protein